MPAVHDLGGDGPPLLLCHATGFHGLVFTPMVPFLAPHFRLWSFDFRGQGDTPAPPGRTYGIAAFATDVLAVVDRLGLERPFAFGHSKGGAAALRAELDRPGTFRALYCFEPIVFPAGSGARGAEDHPLVRAALARREVFPSREAARANYASKPPLSALSPDALAAYVEHGFADQPDGTVRLKCRPAEEAAIYPWLGDGVFERLGEVACPVTVAAGARSDAVPPELAADQAARPPAGRVEVFDDLGHFGPLEGPAQVAAAVVRAFLGR